MELNNALLQSLSEGLKTQHEQHTAVIESSFEEIMKQEFERHKQSVKALEAMRQTQLDLIDKQYGKQADDVGVVTP